MDISKKIVDDLVANDVSFITTVPCKQLAGVMTIVARSKIEGAGGEWNDETEAMIAPMRDALEQQVEQESTALFATGRVWDDGIIEPESTRDVLGLALAAADGAPVEETRFGVFRM